MKECIIAMMLSDVCEEIIFNDKENVNKKNMWLSLFLLKKLKALIQSCLTVQATKQSERKSY